MSNIGFAEYLWVDGLSPAQQIRSRARVVSVPDSPVVTDFPIWNFDESQMGQAEGCESGCILNPVRVYRDPFRGVNDYVVLCEVNDADKKVHASNIRARMRKMLDCLGEAVDPWLGFEQEYTLFRDVRSLEVPGNGVPGSQGSYYCGVGSENVYGRKLAEAHARTCIDAGILIYGMNAVMPGQWAFRVGYRGIDSERCDALTVADDVWVARYLLSRVGEEFDMRVSFGNKPRRGDWNGAGMRANFSTADTRDPNKRQKALVGIVDALEVGHSGDADEYGGGPRESLGGECEARSNDTFASGIAHRGAPIRIPRTVTWKGCVYLEGRCFGVDSDPYRIGLFLIAAAVADGDGNRALRLLQETELLLMKNRQDASGTDTLRHPNCLSKFHVRSNGSRQDGGSP